MYTFRHEYLYKLRRHYREFLFFFTFMYIRRFLQVRIFTGTKYSQLRILYEQIINLKSSLSMKIFVYMAFFSLIKGITLKDT